MVQIYRRLDGIPTSICHHKYGSTSQWQGPLVSAIYLYCTWNERHFVYCQVRTGILNKIYTDLSIPYGRVTSHAVSRPSVIAEARIQSQVNTCVICGDQKNTGRGFLRKPRFFSFNIFKRILRTFLHLHVSLARKTKGESWETSKEEWSSANRKALDRKILFL